VRNFNRSTPLMVAAASNAPKCAKVLLDSAYFQGRPGVGKTGETAQKSFQKKRRDCQRTVSGDTPLIQAAKVNSVEVIQLLLQYKFDMHATNQLGESALSVACKRGFLEATEVLLRKSTRGVEKALADAPIELATQVREGVSEGRYKKHASPKRRDLPSLRGGVLARGGKIRLPQKDVMAGDWQRCHDPFSKGRVYYYNHKTKESTWIRPMDWAAKDKATNTVFCDRCQELVPAEGGRMHFCKWVKADTHNGKIANENRGWLHFADSQTSTTKTDKTASVASQRAPLHENRVGRSVQKFQINKQLPNHKKNMQSKQAREAVV